MIILNRLWPWSKIARLESELEIERRQHDRTDEFSRSCLAYLDHVEPKIKHIRWGKQLMLMGVDSTSVWVSEVLVASEPRMSFKPEGIQ